MRASLRLLLAFSLVSALACGGGGSFDDGDEEDDEDDVGDDTAADTGDSGSGDSADSGDTDDSGDTEDSGDTADSGDAGNTVAAIQEHGTKGTVTLEGVVATSGLSLNGSTFFVQDRGGGPWSGLRVYTEEFQAEIVAGDVLTVTGEVVEYYDDTELIVTSAADIVVTGSASPVSEPLSDPPGDWEAYEGVLVELMDVTLTSGANEYGETTTDWGVPLDDCLFAFGDAGFAVEGDTWDSVTGLVMYSFEAYKVCPRNAGDFD